MLENIQIKNFRCFENFRLEQAAQVTLLGGRNNVGKTALLEAIFLLFAARNSEAFIKVNLIRSNLLSIFRPDVTWEHLFYNKNMNVPINISLVLDGNSIDLILEPNSQVNHIQQFATNFQMQLLPNSYPLQITYKSKKYSNRGLLIPVQNGFTINWDHPPLQNGFPDVKYLGISPDNEQSLAIQFGNVVKAGKKEALINALRKLEPKLEDVSTVAEDIPRLYAQKKNGPMLPLSSMGNGICRLVQIICAMFDSDSSIVLVDEIDSGFHYSFFPQLWRIISDIAKDQSIQIFATTHSYECLSGASACFSGTDEKFLYLRLGRDNSGLIKAHLFTSDLLAYAVETEMEVR